MGIISFAAFIPFLAAIAYFDYKHKIIPNQLTYTAAPTAIALNIVLGSVPAQNVVVGGLLSLIIGLLMMKYVGLGGGDLKLMVVIGLMFGLPMFLAVQLGAYIFGGIVVLLLRLWKREDIDPKEKAPLGVYLCLSGIVVSGWLIFVIAHG